MTANSTLNIIVPCYNPIEGWETNLAGAWAELTKALGDQPVNMILVNDGSTERVTDEKIAFLREKIPGLNYVSYTTNRGKGHALREGVKAADGNTMLFTDIDFPYTIDSMVAMAQTLQGSCDVALGFRSPKYYEKVPPFRKALSLFLRWVLRNVLRLPITDTQCGLKGFNRQGREVFLKTRINRFLFDLEFVQLVARNKALMAKPLEVTLRDDVTFSKVNLRVLATESLNFVVLLFRR